MKYEKVAKFERIFVNQMQDHSYGPKVSHALNFFKKFSIQIVSFDIFSNLLSQIVYHQLTIKRFFHFFSFSYNQSHEFISEELSLHPLKLEDGSPESPLTETLYLSPHEEKEIAFLPHEDLEYAYSGKNFHFSFKQVTKVCTLFVNNLSL